MDNCFDISWFVDLPLRTFRWNWMFWFPLQLEPSGHWRHPHHHDYYGMYWISSFQRLCISRCLAWFWSHQYDILGVHPGDFKGSSCLSIKSRRVLDYLWPKCWFCRSRPLSTTKLSYTSYTHHDHKRILYHILEVVILMLKSSRVLAIWQISPRGKKRKVNLK